MSSAIFMRCRRTDRPLPSVRRHGGNPVNMLGLDPGLGRGGAACGQRFTGCQHRPGRGGNTHLGGNLPQLVRAIGGDLDRHADPSAGPPIGRPPLTASGVPGLSVSHVCTRRIEVGPTFPIRPASRDQCVHMAPMLVDASSASKLRVDQPLVDQLHGDQPHPKRKVGLGGHGRHRVGTRLDRALGPLAPSLPVRA